MLELQQDNDSTHRATPTIIAAYRKAKGCNNSVVGGWTPSSPYLSPIENVCSYFQTKLHARG